MKWLAVAFNTFKEAIRNHILYNLLVFALLIIGGSTVIGNLTIGQGSKVITDIGLASISIFGVLIAIFVGIGLVYHEIDKKTIYNILSKPIRKSEFLFGKYMGLMMTLAINVLLMTLGLFITLYYIDGIFAWSILPAVFLIFFELMIVTSVAILFSTFSTPTLSAIFTLSIYVIGHLTEDLVRLGENTESIFIKAATRFLYYILPNLENFNIKTQVVHHLSVKSGYYLTVFAYGCIYLSIIVLLAVYIFARRNFN
jgi:ABC-type transport system involved in multi-copper enzyme maturation permease subunit